MQKILLPINYSPPYDLENDSNINSYVIDMGYKIYLSLEKYTKAINIAKIGLHNEEAKVRYDELLKEEIYSYELKLNDIKATQLDNDIKHKNTINHIKLLHATELESLNNELKNTCNNNKDSINHIKSLQATELESLNDELNNMRANNKDSINHIKSLHVVELESLKDELRNMNSLHKEELIKEKLLYTSEIELLNNEIKNMNRSQEIVYKDSINNLKNDHSAEIELLNNELRNTTKKAQEKLLKEIDLLNNDINNTRASHKDELRDLMISYKKDLSKIESIQTTELSEAKAMISSLNKKISDSSDLTLTKCMDIYKKSEEKEKALVSIINDKENTNKLLTTQLSSYIKPMTAVSIGAVGEELISGWVTELFTNASITDMSHITAAGDLHVKINNRLLLLEIKNKNTIVKSDIDKFIRDVNENTPDITGGLFISINSPSIPGRGDFSLEYVNNVPVIYLYVPDKSVLKVAIKTLLFINGNVDDALLLMTINSMYSKLTALSSSVSVVEKCLTDSKYATENLRKEIRNSLAVLNDLFEDNPSMKFETMAAITLEFNGDEIKAIHDLYKKNSKAKIADYAKNIGCSVKYLQDRGGAAKIKKITSEVVGLLLKF